VPRNIVAVIRCVVESVRIHELTEQHVVNLKDDSGAILPIWIAPDTASAIGNALAGNTSERPLTHDLLLSSFEKLGVRVARVGITGFVPFSDPTKTGGVFYATLYLERKAAIDLANRKRHPEWPQYHGNVEQQKDRIPERERER